MVGDFVVFGVGDGFGGATVRVRVEGDIDESTADELEFCANATPAHEQTTEAMTRSFFISFPLGFSQTTKLRDSKPKPSLSG